MTNGTITDKEHELFEESFSSQALKFIGGLPSNIFDHNGSEYSNSTVDFAYDFYKAGLEQGKRIERERIEAIFQEIIEINTRPHLVDHPVSKRNVEEANYYLNTIRARIK